MPRKLMTNLYYVSKQAAREDCDTLGIDRRRVRTIRHGHRVQVWDYDAGCAVFVQLVAILRVDSALIEKVGVDVLQNDDSEDYG